MDCVIVGGGVAGFQAAFSCRSLWPDKSVTLIDAEKEVGYYRTLLPQFIVGTLAERKLFFRQPEKDPMFTVLTGVEIRSVDRRNQRLHHDNGQPFNFDRLILAVGGRPIVPPICTNHSCAEGIFPIRYLTVARTIRKWIPNHPDIVVLGGGLVGVKTAAHLANDGLSVTLVEKENRLLPQALSSNAAARVQNHLEQLGIRLILGGTVEDIRIAQGRLRSVRAGGKWVPCETLLVAIGSTPDVSFLKESGLLKHGQLVVSPGLQTSDDKIFAVGDAVTIEKDGTFTPWTWPQAVCQGRLAAANLYSQAPVPLKAMSRVNAMNLFGLSLIILGAPVPGSEVISYSSPDTGTYRELFLTDDRIVGGALVGDASGAGFLHAWMNSGKKIDETVTDRLRPHVKTFFNRTWEDVNPNRRHVSFELSSLRSSRLQRENNGILECWKDGF